MKKFYWFASMLTIVLGVTFTSCDDDDSIPEPEIPAVPTETSKVYILNGGMDGQNNATLSMLDMESGEMTADIFADVNGRALGNMGQSMLLYGSKLYISVYRSSTLEVLDAATSKVITTLKPVDSEGAPRAPRMMASHEGKVYMTTFDGFVAKIDTASLAIEGYTAVGPNPDGIAIAHGKIYPADTDGMHWPSTSDKLSVVDIASFKKIGDVTVGLNPNHVFSDSEGDIYAVCYGDYKVGADMLYRVDTKDDKAEAVDGVNVTKMYVKNDTAYCYVANYYNPDGKAAFTFDLKTDKVINPTFIKDFSVFTSDPSAIGVDPVSGDVYYGISSYFQNDDIFIFDKEGTLKKTVEVGMSPSTFAFVTNQ